MAKKTVDNETVIQLLLAELKSVKAELNALKANTSGDSKTSEVRDP